MRTNRKLKKNIVKTHEGAVAKRITPEQELRRSVMSCFLWEREFYENGESIADRIKNLIPKVDPRIVQSIAIDARNKAKLRHIPLFIVREMCRLVNHKKYVKETLFEIIQRPDELTEFLSLYWKEGRESLSGQVKKGLAKAFTKFNRYQLGKYNRKEDIKLRDVLFLTHPKPKDDVQEKDWKDLIEGNLEAPDTWEVSLSVGKDKKSVWERLLSEKKLGGLALLRNLRNMQDVGVDKSLIISAISTMNTEKILPFRFISAARYAPSLEEYLDKAMLSCLKSKEVMGGKTIILVDVSYSMVGRVSFKSDISRMEAACGVSILARELFEDVEIFSFSKNLVQVPSRRGFALKDAILTSQRYDGTDLGGAVSLINKKIVYDRLIVFTDEQSCSSVPNPTGLGYMINVASCKNGVGYGKWVHIDGFSESSITFIQEYEKEFLDK